MATGTAEDAFKEASKNVYVAFKAPWAVFTILFLTFVLVSIAAISAARTRSRYKANDIEKAKNAITWTLCVTWIALPFVLLGTILFLVGMLRQSEVEDD